MLFCLKLIFFLVYNCVWGLLCAISDTFPIVNCVYVCEISIFVQILFRPGGAAVSQRCGDVFGQTFFHQCNSYPSSALHTVQQQQQQLKKKKPAKIIRFTSIFVNKNFDTLRILYRWNSWPSPSLETSWCSPCSRCCRCSCSALYCRPGGWSPRNCAGHRTSSLLLSQKKTKCVQQYISTLIGSTDVTAKKNAFVFFIYLFYL